MSNILKWICPDCFYINEDDISTELTLPINMHCQHCNHETEDLRITSKYAAFKENQQYMLKCINGDIKPDEDFIYRWKHFHYTLN